MIITRLAGGIGNQLFQYAFGLSQARRLKTELRLNTEILSNTPVGWTKYNYELDCFKGITEQIDNNTSGLKLYKEGDKGDILNDTVLDGYWQNEKFVGDIKIEFKEELVQFIGEEMKNTVSIHARRGDYLVGNHFIDLSKTDYYRKAIEYIREKTNNSISQFIIFSNDVEWAEEYFNFLNKGEWFVVREHPEKLTSKSKTVEDLYYMSHCHHNITANSSYSWWAAKLNKNTDKMVIQPKQWYVNKPNYNSLYFKDAIIL
jgi:hypothetical protein